MTVKMPVAPDVPQLPAVLDPFTELTAPDARGHSIRTLVALTVVPAVVPTAAALSPTQTLAKVADATPASRKLVLALTSTVSVVPFLRRMVKLDVAPATPHVPSAVTTPIDSTVPIGPLRSRLP
jgi:hypothetical protein